MTWNFLGLNITYVATRTRDGGMRLCAVVSNRWAAFSVVAEVPGKDDADPDVEVVAAPASNVFTLRTAPRFKDLGLQHIS